MAADHIDRAKSATTFKSNVDCFSLHGGKVPGGVACGGGGGDRCPVESDGSRPLERASSMPGRIPPASCGSSLLRRGLRPPFRTPSATTTASQPEFAPPPYEPETGGKAESGKVAPEVFVSAASAAASAERTATPSTALRRHLGSTSFSFRRKRVLGVPIDENNVPQIDRAVSPLPSAAGSPTETNRDVGTTHIVTTRESRRQPIYTRRFASLRLPSSARTTGSIGSSTARPHPSSSLLSPASAVNGASDHRPLGGSYARMQLLQNIGNHQISFGHVWL